MTFWEFLCRVCAGSVRSFVQGLSEHENLIFQALKHFVHSVHSNARTYAYRRVRVCVHTHMRVYMRMHKPCTPCTHSYFSFKNNGISLFKTMHELCTNPAQYARF